MSYQRLYPQRINWEDEPSIATPVNQVNLNKMDAAIYGIDGRVVELDENKVDKTETFNTTRNGVVPKPTQADITNEKVLRADGSWVAQSGGGGGGGGHTIVDNAGTSLTQRSKLKTVGGLNATDDSINDTTKITDVVEEVPWATWKSYPSEAEALQAHPNCVVTGAPDCDGDIEIEFLKLAWTNPNPTSSFASQSITLDTNGDYDFVRVYYIISTQDTRIKSLDIEKGKGTYMDLAATSGSVIALVRLMSYVSDTSLSFGDAYKATTSTQTADNTSIIPYKIYVGKYNITAKIQAIARSVKATRDYSTDEHLIGTWIDGSDLYEKTIDCGAVPNATSKNVAHNISNLKRIVEYCGYAYSTSNANSIPLPFATNTTFVRVNSNGSSYIAISTGSDLSAYNESYVTIRYTKTS